jgi:hypothetical protein
MSKARTIRCACFSCSTKTERVHWLAQLREYAARSFGPSPDAAPWSIQLLTRSLNEPRPEGSTVGCDGGASICGTTGTSILGGGKGGGGGGLNCDAPGGSICAETELRTTRAAITAPMQSVTIDVRFINDMS